MNVCCEVGITEILAPDQHFEQEGTKIVFEFVMSNKSDIGFSLVAIGNQLKNFRFVVPRYQRSYAWKKENVEDLYKDIYSALNASQNEYFLGSIVVSEDENYFEVIDGQQRLATISILIAAIRDYYRNKNDVESVSDIEKNYLFNRDFETKEKLPRLELGKSDNDFFQKFVIQSEDNRALDSYQYKPKESQEKIKVALQIAGEFVETIIKPSQNPHAVLSKLLKYIEESVKVIRVDVPDYANAFTIFETLNARGLDLTESDLIKNHLFSTAKDRIDEVENKWVSMTATIETVEKEQEVVSFIKYFYASKYEAVRKKELYKGIKDKTDNKQKAVDFAGALEENAKRYVAILNSDDNFWNDFNNRTLVKSYVQTLNEFGIIHSRPLLLAILEHFNKTEIEKSLKLLVSWSVRFLISGSVSSGTFEAQFSQKAIDVRNGFHLNKNKQSVPVKSANDLSLIMDIVPSDVEFEEKFSSDGRITTSKFARYILRVLEREKQNVKEPEKVINADESDVNLEHVLPQNPSPNWGNLTDEEASVYYSKIGNLALLQKTPNSKIGNLKPSDKEPVLSKSEILLTRMIGDEIQSSKNWGIKEIQKRQKELANLAVKAWSLRV